MKFTLGIAAFSSLLALLLSACAKERPQTVEFFEKKTGLPLCRTAQVRNFQVGKYDDEIDFTYGVHLTMSDTCQRDFLYQIEHRLGYICRPSTACNFMDQNNWSYELTPISDGRIKFILRAI